MIATPTRVSRKLKKIPEMYFQEEPSVQRPFKTKKNPKRELGNNLKIIMIPPKMSKRPRINRPGDLMIITYILL